MNAWRQALVWACLVMLWALYPPTFSSAVVSTTWTGRWNGSVVVTAGPDAGSTLPCEFLISQSGSGFAGTASCSGSGTLTFSGTETGAVAGTVSGGISFSGVRRGGSATGTWTYPGRGNSGTWSITRTLQ